MQQLSTRQLTVVAAAAAQSKGEHLHFFYEQPGLVIQLGLELRPVCVRHVFELLPATTQVLAIAATLQDIRPLIIGKLDPEVGLCVSWKVIYIYEVSWKGKFKI